MVVVAVAGMTTVDLVIVGDCEGGAMVAPQVLQYEQEKFGVRRGLDLFDVYSNTDNVDGLGSRDFARALSSRRSLKKINLLTLMRPNTGLIDELFLPVQLLGLDLYQQHQK